MEGSYQLRIMTLSLREPNQIFASPQYKFPIESSQISHKTEINFGTLSILSIDLLLWLQSW